MSTITLTAFLGTTGLVDVGLRFIDADGVFTGARITSGVYELAGARGVYGIKNPTVPSDAVSIYWDSTGTTSAYAYEPLDYFMTRLLVNRTAVYTGHVLLSDGLEIAVPSTAGRPGASISGNGAEAITFVGGNDVAAITVIAGTGGTGNAGAIRFDASGNSPAIAVNGGGGNSDGIQISGTGTGADIRLAGTKGITVAGTTLFSGSLTVNGAVHFVSTFDVDGIFTANDTSNDIRGVRLSATQAFNNTGTWTGNLSGSVGSVTGNVGGNVVGTVASVVGNVGGNVVGTVASVVGNVGGNVTGSVGSIAANGITDSSYAIATGKRVIRSGTAQAGTATTLTLDAGANATNKFYTNDLLVITGGTGTGQARFITGYGGLSKIATVETWITTPDNTSTFAILPWDAAACTCDGLGSKAVTIHTEDENAANLGSVFVTMLDGADALVASGFTNGSGDYLSNLIASTQYTILTFKGGYTSAPSIQTTSAGNGAETLTTIVLTGNPSPPPPANPDLCTVFGYLVDGAGDPLAGATLTVQAVAQNPVTRPIVATGGTVLTTNAVDGVTDANGYVAVDVVRTDVLSQPVSYTITASNNQINRKGVKLASASKDIADL